VTPLIREAVKLIAEHLDPAEMHWFDATGCSLPTFEDDVYVPLYENRPPFQHCMVCAEFFVPRVSEIRRLLLLISGNDPENGIKVTAWRQRANDALVPSPTIEYVTDGECLWHRSADENVVVDDIEVKTILGFVATWYESLGRRNEAYVPYAPQTFMNRRKIAQGKVPFYEWRTVVIEPTTPRKESLGGTHASPRHHDRRGHMRKLKNGRSVWVKPCKVGNPSKGVVFHDYKIKEMQS